MNSTEGDRPPEALVRSLVEGPSAVAGFEWHPVVDSTNDLAWEAAERGVPEIHVVATDFQRAGRGRLGRTWEAPAGTSLMLSLVLRPTVDTEFLPLLPLLAALSLAEAAGPHCPGAQVGLKWPNDVLLDGRKTSGILAEGPRDGVVVLGIGVNVDWRGVARSEELAEATSLVEAGGGPIDRWRLLAALLGVFAARYTVWVGDPRGFLDEYRRRSTTLGQRVRVTMTGGDPVEGGAVAIADNGALELADDDGYVRRVAAGDVEHLRTPTLDS